MDYLGKPNIVTHCEESMKLGREYWRCFTTGYEKGGRVSCILSQGCKKSLEQKEAEPGASRENTAW